MHPISVEARDIEEFLIQFEVKAQTSFRGERRGIGEERDGERDQFASYSSTVYLRIAWKAQMRWPCWMQVSVFWQEEQTTTGPEANEVQYSSALMGEKQSDNHDFIKKIYMSLSELALHSQYHVPSSILRLHYIGNRVPVKALEGGKCENELKDSGGRWS